MIYFLLNLQQNLSGVRLHSPHTITLLFERKYRIKLKIFISRCKRTDIAINYTVGTFKKYSSYVFLKQNITYRLQKQ